MWLYLHVILCDLDLCCVDVVYQQAQSPTVHLLYPHSFRPALCHLTCWFIGVRHQFTTQDMTKKKQTLKQTEVQPEVQPDGQKTVLTCEHSMEVGTASSQNHPVSSNLYVLRHYGHVTQQALAVWAFKSLRG